jgi:hypothetical protein
VKHLGAWEAYAITLTYIQASAEAVRRTGSCVGCRFRSEREREENHSTGGKTVSNEIENDSASMDFCTKETNERRRMEAAAHTRSILQLIILFHNVAEPASQQHSQYAQTVFFWRGGQEKDSNTAQRHTSEAEKEFLCPKSFSSPLCWRIKSTSLAVERRLVSYSPLWSLFLVRWTSKILSLAHLLR